MCSSLHPSHTQLASSHLFFVSQLSVTSLGYFLLIIASKISFNNFCIIIFFTMYCNCLFTYLYYSLISISRYWRQHPKNILSSMTNNYFWKEGKKEGREIPALKGPTVQRGSKEQTWKELSDDHAVPCGEFKQHAVTVRDWVPAGDQEICRPP